MKWNKIVIFKLFFWFWGYTMWCSGDTPALRLGVTPSGVLGTMWCRRSNPDLLHAKHMLYTSLSSPFFLFCFSFRSDIFKIPFWARKKVEQVRRLPCMWLTRICSHMVLWNPSCLPACLLEWSWVYLGVSSEHCQKKKVSLPINGYLYLLYISSFQLLCYWDLHVYLSSRMTSWNTRIYFTGKETGLGIKTDELRLVTSFPACYDINIIQGMDVVLQSDTFNFYFVLFVVWDQIWLCPGLTPGGLFKDHSWMCLGDPMCCQELKPG